MASSAAAARAVADSAAPAVADDAAPAVADDAAPAVADEQKDVLVSKCARDPPPGGRRWRGGEVSTASIVITAGFCGKSPHVARSLVYNMDGVNDRCVHMHKHASGLICAVAGPQAHKGDIGAVKVLDDIRRQFFGTDHAAVADKDDVDPMEALDAVAETQQKKTRDRHRGVVSLTMPKRPPCSGLEQDQTQTIYVYLKPGNRSLHLHTDGLDWLVAYAADENHYPGTVREVPKPLPATAVADYQVGWDVNATSWECTVLVGPAQGQSKRFDPEDMSRPC